MIADGILSTIIIALTAAVYFLTKSRGKDKERIKTLDLTIALLNDRHQKQQKIWSDYANRLHDSADGKLHFIELPGEAGSDSIPTGTGDLQTDRE